jgi:RNA polymerase sigma-70 factor (ECF subfamily)
MVRDFNETQDIVQQTSLTLWEKFDDYKPDRDFGLWACGVAKYKTLNHLRTEGRRKSRFSEAFLIELAAMEESIEADELDSRRDALSQCVKKLPEKQAELLWSCYRGRETVAEIASSLGRTADGVYGSLRNIRRKLQDCIERSLAREGLG